VEAAVRFHIEFSYRAEEREKLLSFLHGGGLAADGPLKVLGAWIAVQTGTGFALVETKDSRAFYQLCSVWSDYGQLKVTPVIEATEI
jgi:hypothetical protein